ncbi:hypothetical protein E8E14_011300 [Neopestalotiopsis sp. 37M]|nr:hypothetical protein E8E14_011300 [Neopestalotiopsis sp. 37M]
MAGSVSLLSLTSGAAQACCQTAEILVELSDSVSTIRAGLRSVAAECISTKVVLQRLAVFIKPDNQGPNAANNGKHHHLHACFRALVQPLPAILDEINIESQRMRQYSSEETSLVQAKLNRLLQDLLYDARHNLRKNRSSISIIMDCVQGVISGILAEARLHTQPQSSPSSSTEKIRSSPQMQAQLSICLTQQMSQPHIQQQKNKIKSRPSRSSKTFMTESKLTKKLHEGIRNGDHGVVIKAISSAADPNGTVKGSKVTPIHSALSQTESVLGCEDEVASRDLVMIVMALVLAGADLHAVDDEGRTPLVRVAKGEMGDGLVALMLESGAEVNAADKEGNTALHYAAMQNNLLETGNVETIKILLANGADLRAQNRRGRTPLYESVMWEHIDQTAQLIDYGSDLEISDSHGWTPLYAAVFQGHTHLTRLLCERGAFVDEKDKTGQAPLHYAISQGRCAIVQVLVEAGADVNLIAKGETPLCRAAAKTNSSVIEFLLQHGADVSVPSPGYHGALPIHIAAIGKDLDVLNALISAGSFVNARDGAGRTPLAWARESGRNEIAEFLKGKGAEA